MTVIDVVFIGLATMALMLISIGIGMFIHKGMTPSEQLESKAPWLGDGGEDI